MFGVILPIIVWVIVGCFAVYVHGNTLRDSAGVIEVAALVLTWPWWLNQNAQKRVV